MKILVVSDTHRNHDHLEKVAEIEKPDQIFHLGDAEGKEDYIEAVCGCPVEIVRGNCDLVSALPSELIVEVEGKRFLLTHGHYYNVQFDDDMLLETAIDKKVDCALYGHTHFPELVELSGVTIMNPGSISYPRQPGKKPSYGLIEVDEAGEFQFSLHYLDV